MSFSQIQPLREIPLAIVDVETTGASADFGHRIIEMGIARVENGAVVAEYERLLDPQRKISAGVTVLTGITQAMVEGQPTFCDELPRMLELLKGAIVIGHNVRFDLSFLRKEFRRARCEIMQVLGDVPVLDTVRIARRRFGRGGNGLQTLCRRLGIFPVVAHRALADVRTTFGVLEKMLEPIGGWNIELADALLAQGGRMGLLPANPRESLLPLELEEALETRRPVMMEYLDGQEVRTQRIVRPLTIRRINGELTLIAFCELRQANRTFKLERMVRLTRIEEGGAPPAAVVPTRAVVVDVQATALMLNETPAGVDLVTDRAVTVVDGSGVAESVSGTGRSGSKSAQEFSPAAEQVVGEAYESDMRYGAATETEDLTEAVGLGTEAGPDGQADECRGGGAAHPAAAMTQQDSAGVLDLLREAND
jgi:DNA polymerase III epsilon subunit family exonuclease